MEATKKLVESRAEHAAARSDAFTHAKTHCVATMTFLGIKLEEDEQAKAATRPGSRGEGRGARVGRAAAASSATSTC